MGEKIKVEIGGLNDLLNNIKRVGGNVTDVLIKVTGIGSEIIVGQTKENIIAADLVDTGFMVNSMGYSEPIVENDKVTRNIGSSADYHIYHELGTIYLPATPTLRPALDETEDAIFDATKEILIDYLKEKTGNK